jgi:hypothetical protein
LTVADEALQKKSPRQKRIGKRVERLGRTAARFAQLSSWLDSNVFEERIQSISG